MSDKIAAVRRALASDRAEDMKVILNFAAKITKGIEAVQQPGNCRWDLTDALYDAVGSVARAEQAVVINDHITAAVDECGDNEQKLLKRLQDYEVFLRDELVKAHSRGADAHAIASIQYAARNEAKHAALKYTLPILLGIMGVEEAGPA